MRKIKGYNHYFVDKKGRIFSSKSGTLIERKTTINTSGYPQLTLWKGGKARTHSVHRLVAETYIRNTKNKAQVNHKNGIKTDNRVENLEWVTHSENTTHAYGTGLMKKRFGSANGKSKAICQLTKGGELIAEFGSACEAQRHTGFRQGNICACANGIKGFRTAGGYLWKWKDAA